MNGRRGIFLLVIALALGACFRNTAPIHYYMLKPLEPAGSSHTKTRRMASDPVIGLGPIRIPDYLDRPQIVSAVSDEEYNLAEDHRWAERLDETLTRVLAENLSALVPTQRVVLHPWPREQKVDAQITVNVQELHLDATGRVRLIARWTVRHSEQGFADRESSCRLPASSADYQVIVDAQSRCIGQLSQEIAGTVRTLLGSAGSQR